MFPTVGVLTLDGGRDTSYEYQIKMHGLHAFKRYCQFGYILSIFGFGGEGGDIRSI